MSARRHHHHPEHFSPIHPPYYDARTESEPISNRPTVPNILCERRATQIEVIGQNILMLGVVTAVLTLLISAQYVPTAQ